MYMKKNEGIYDIKIYFLVVIEKVSNKTLCKVFSCESSFVYYIFHDIMIFGPTLKTKDRLINAS